MNYKCNKILNFKIRNNIVLLFCLILFIFIMMYLLPSYSRLLWQPDETRYAEISREMLYTKNWIVPHLLGIRYFEKPLGGYWINCFFQKILGNSNFAVRFASIFSTVISALIIFYTADMIWHNLRKSLLSVLIFLSSLIVLSLGTYNTLDAIFTMWLTLAMNAHISIFRANKFSCHIKAWFIFGIACGLGFMTKGFIAIVIPGLLIFFTSFFYKKKKFLFIYSLFALLLVILINTPWLILINKQETDFLHYFFWVEHINRFFSKNAQHCAPFWYYMPILALGTLPWTGLLPGAIYSSWLARQISMERFLLFYWVIIPLIFFTLSQGKLLTYILPCMPPLSLLIAIYIEEQLKNVNTNVFYINATINIVLACFIILFLLISEKKLIKTINLTTINNSLTCILLIILALINWIFFAYKSVCLRRNYLMIIAMCPLLLSILIEKMIPHNVIDIKQPQNFICKHKNILEKSTYLLSNDVGIASTLAWELKRSNICLYNKKGELEYGLKYNDSKNKFVSHNNFLNWLISKRQRGNIALLLSDLEYLTFNNFPNPDYINYNRRLTLIFYKKVSK